MLLGVSIQTPDMGQQAPPPPPPPQRAPEPEPQPDVEMTGALTLPR